MRWIAIALFAIGCSNEYRALSPSECGLTCEPGPPPPPDFQPETTCYDGCNWCECTTDGVYCTARACADAGVDGSL